jgi:hypothetical protein
MGKGRRWLRGRVTAPARGRRSGIVAITFAVAMLLLVFTGTLAFLLTIMASGLQVENSLDSERALCAAEAGMDSALQSGRTGTATGQVGGAWYAVSVEGGRVTAVGQVERAAGTPARAAVSAQAAGGGIARGSWRQIPPASRPDLIGLLDSSVQGSGTQ